MRAQKRLNRAYEELPLADAVTLSIDEFARAYAGGEPQRLMRDYLARRRK